MLRYLFILWITLCCIFLGYRLNQPNHIQTDLTALLPQQSQPDLALRIADKINENQLNQQIIMLVGHSQPESAFSSAQNIAKLWEKSQLFQEINSKVVPDLAQMQHDIQFLSLATLPEKQQQQLLNQPKHYFQQRAEDAANPFAISVLPLEQDWLGLGRFVHNKINLNHQLQWQPENGMLFTEQEGKTWVWLRATLPKQYQTTTLLSLMRQSDELAAEQQAQTLKAGGALFAATAKVEAEHEAQYMSLIGLTLTFALLIWVFRSARVFWLFLPIVAGQITGLTATIALLGEVHILTIVIGTSLVGMLVDYPLHWLAPALFRQHEHWQAQDTMRQVLPNFMVSLVVTILGYVLLWFTPLPVLRQTAIFSGFALLGAFIATVLWLPALFRTYHGKTTLFANLAMRLNHVSGCLKTILRQPIIAISLLIFVAIGIYRSNWHDDIRQWVNMSPQILNDTQTISRLSDMSFGGTYIVVEDQSQDNLLLKNAQINQLLQPLIYNSKLKSVQSLDQFILPQSTQQQLKQQFAQLANQPDNWAAMRKIGIPDEVIQHALQQAASMPDVSLSDSLNSTLTEGWRTLYLGEIAPQRFASIIRLNQLNDAHAVQAALNHQAGVYWVDKRTTLNDLFQHTRNQAAWLKISSYALALLLLWKIFGLKRASQIILIPLAAALTTVAILGWLHIPISLFVMFGLLLVSAIGVDYAVYAIAVQHSSHTRFGGMLLAALTTLISFILLTLSTTPVVAAFGLSVSIGVVLNLLFASMLLDKRFAFD